MAMCSVLYRPISFLTHRSIRRTSFQLRRFSAGCTLLNRLDHGQSYREISQRSYSKLVDAADQPNLWEEYYAVKEKVTAKHCPFDQDPHAVYANNELNLEEIEVFGFDYDYTIAVYTEELNRLIYDLGRNTLVNDAKYPKDLAHPPYDYNPSFAVRGLHCDIQKGLLMKIDAFHNIQLGTVYRGMQPVADEEVLEMFQGSHIGVQGISGDDRPTAMIYQLMDLFALPEMTLYANVIEFFINNDIAYDPEYVFYDVRGAIASLHQSQTIHHIIMNNLEKYLRQLPAISRLLKRLNEANKKIFLVTNSGIQFVDAGMKYLVGENWMDYFDVVIVNARKPKFFSESNRQFRMYDPKMGVKSWSKVEKLEKGCIYQEGNYYQLISLTGWAGHQVLYMGDHVYNDLADAIKLGWRTGAIIPELEDEITTINTEKYKKSITWLFALESLISKMQKYRDPESLKILSEWQAERTELRQITKNIFNPRFGSLFRSYHNPTYFSRRSSRFADIYMSSIVNLLGYSLQHTFYPRRAALSHELNIDLGDIIS